MTTPNDFGDPNTVWDEPGETDWFDAAAAQGHLLIVRFHDAPQYFRTQNNPDGMVHPTRGATWEPFPNLVVRATVADLNLYGEDGGLGKIYKEAVIFPSSLTKPLKGQVGNRRLMMWSKVPSKPGQPAAQTDPYKIVNMAGNEQAVTAAREFLARHPEFDGIAAPEPYDGKPPAPQQGGWGPQPGYGQQPYPPAQPGYGPPPQQQPQWQPQGPGPYGQPPQWQQPQWLAQQPGNYPQQPPAGPPQYSPPQAQPRQGSFLQQAAQQPQYYPQHEPSGQGQVPNHQGGWQNTEAPF